MSAATPARRWPFVVLAVLGIAGAVYRWLGQVMAGSFSMAAPWPPPPGHEQYWHRVAKAYFILSVCSLGVLVAALIALWRRRVRAGDGLGVPPS